MMDQILIDVVGLTALILGRQRVAPFRQQCKSDNNARTIYVRVWLAKSRNDSIPPAFCRPEVDKENLIFAVMDNGAQSLAAAKPGPKL
jgi:hypothetical protein